LKNKNQQLKIKKKRKEKKGSDEASNKSKVTPHIVRRPIIFATFIFWDLKFLNREDDQWKTENESWNEIFL
jgi:hypothetical protein